MKRKLPSDDHCNRIFNCLSPPEKQVLLSQLPNYNQLCEATTEKDPSVFRDIITLLSPYLEYDDYNALKTCCGTFYRRLGRYPPLARLKSFYDNCLTEDLPLDMMHQYFRIGVFDYIKRMFVETGITLDYDPMLLGHTWLKKKYYRIGPAMVHYPTGLLLKSSGGNISRKNPRGHIYQETPSDTFHDPAAKYITYIDGHMSKKQKLAIKKYDSFLSKNKYTL